MTDDSDGTEFFSLAVAAATGIFLLINIGLVPSSTRSVAGLLGLAMYSFGTVVAGKLAIIKARELVTSDSDDGWSDTVRTEPPEGHPMRKDDE